MTVKKYSIFQSFASPDVCPPCSVHFFNNQSNIAQIVIIWGSLLLQLVLNHDTYPETTLWALA